MRMNWLFSIIFLSIIFLIYNLIGKVILKIFGYENASNEKKLLGGFFFIFFIGFIVGVPCQLFHLNWKVFKYIMLLLLFLVIFICLKLEKDNIRYTIYEIRKSPLKFFLKNIKDYWFLYVLVIAFSILSMTNCLSYYKMNYDDSYYIGKIVNQVGADALMSENYYNANIISGFDGGITRILNTFELSYGLFADLFSISIPFFCRVPMTIHNYLLVFICFKEFGSMFVDRKYSQYTLLPFTILLISSGFLMNSPKNEFIIRMYDGWQFQTAIFYGGSVVRVMTIPSLCIFGIELVKKLEFKKILFLAIIYLTLVSFSTIFITYAILLTYIFVIIKLLYLLYFRLQTGKKVITITLLLLLAIILLILTKKLDTFSLINNDIYKYNVEEFMKFFDYYFNSDTVIYYGPFILTACFFGFKSTKQKASVLIVLILFLIFYCNKFVELIILSTINNFFVALRVITSMQLMILVFTGICIVTAVKILFEKINILVLLSISTLLAVFGYIYINIDYIYEQDFLGSGMTTMGYSINNILRNQEMMPDIMVEVGEYFNSLDYGNYSLILPNEVSVDYATVPSNGFIITSNRIELCSYNGCKNMTNDEYDKVNKYFKKEVPYGTIMPILKKHEIKYILVTDVEQKKELELNNCEVVKFGNKEDYYLLKTPY